ncbi:uncharacterized protein LOC124163695 [Ischnura elegans]|uniref:uncharacterized protein LOC124163695 n=1 Tax=Ischnura elegans TaxID=197161 RepID=UPI001ED895EF|nr:uncharacterized protein LOC124163695 [Ischnura elegans]
MISLYSVDSDEDRKPVSKVRLSSVIWFLPMDGTGRSSSYPGNTSGSSGGIHTRAADSGGQTRACCCCCCFTAAAAASSATHRSPTHRSSSITHGSYAITSYPALGNSASALSSFSGAHGVPAVVQGSYTVAQCAAAVVHGTFGTGRGPSNGKYAAGHGSQADGRPLTGRARGLYATIEGLPTAATYSGPQRTITLARRPSSVLAADDNGRASTPPVRDISDEVELKVKHSGRNILDLLGHIGSTANWIFRPSTVPLRDYDTNPESLSSCKQCYGPIRFTEILCHHCDFAMPRDSITPTPLFMPTDGDE